MSTVFIAGTDTGVGKTIVASHLAAYGAGKGHKTIVQKWVQTGSRPLSDDIHLAIKLLKLSDNEVAKLLPSMVPYSFRYPCSPHLAAHMEGVTICEKRICTALHYLKQHYDFVIIEGSGGLMVPLRRDYLLLDLITQLSLPVILVVNNKLGAINHTLLSIEILKQRDISLLGLIFNNMVCDEDTRIMEDNIDIIPHISGTSVLGTIPYIQSLDQMPDLFETLGETIFRML
ncbi:MAG: dethiobiotin synthase [bacterium]